MNCRTCNQPIPRTESAVRESAECLRCWTLRVEEQTREIEPKTKTRDGHGDRGSRARDVAASRAERLQRKGYAAALGSHIPHDAIRTQHELTP
jgi:hypothetical protein